MNTLILKNVILLLQLHFSMKSFLCQISYKPFQIKQSMEIDR